MRSRRTVIALALVALMATPPTVADAHARQSESAQIAVTAAPLSEKETRNLKAIAGAEDAQQVDAATRYAWQNDVAVAATELETRFPDAYAGTEIISNDPPSAVIRFKGAVPSVAADLFSHVSPGVQIKIEGSEPLSQTEINRLVEQVTRLAWKASGATSLATDYERATGRVTVTASVGPNEQKQVSRVANRISESLERSGVHNVRVVTVPDAAIDEARNGGGRLEVGGGAGLECTAGFNVINAAGTSSGIATAGHCSNSLTHENISGQTEYAVSYVAGHVGTYGDFQWGVTSDTEIDDFFYNAGVLRDVSSVASPIVNQYLCRYGQTTGAQCAEVENNNICSTTSSGTACNLTRMKNDEASGGDSGGPWYYGNTAYGFHRGSVGTILGSRDVFSKATLIDEALGGVRVRTS